MRAVAAKAPLKLNFAGGETDIRPFYATHGPGVVFTTAIKRYAYAFVSEAEAGYRISYPGFTGTFDRLEAINHVAIREALRRLEIGPGISVTTASDVPWGTGLGSSSSYLVALLLALHAWREEDPSPEALAREAFSVSEAAGEPGGKQDPYVAAYGGTGLFIFNGDESVEFKALPLSVGQVRELEAFLLLCDSGLTRRSPEVQAAQERGVEAHLKDFEEMRELALRGYEAASVLDVEGLAHIADQYWRVRKRAEPSVSNPAIEELYSKGIAAGALGGRLEGAGAAGFMLFFVPPEKKGQVLGSLKGYRTMEVELEPRGARIVWSEDS